MHRRNSSIASTTSDPGARGGEARAGSAAAGRGSAKLHRSRSRSDHLLTGVAAGIGERLGVEPVFVRAAFVVLSTAAGAGVVLYLLAWMLIPPNDLPPSSKPVSAMRAPRPRKAPAFGLMVLGGLLLLRDAGLWFGDRVVWPVAMAAVGSAVIASRSNEGDLTRWGWLARRLSALPVARAVTGRTSALRILFGALLVVGGMATFLAASEPLLATRSVLLPMLVTLAGATLILGPWIMSLARQLSDERRERIRSEERAEVAAHLHDSVLQTLALIQRSETPREMASLARSQERELRAWLYNPVNPDDGELVSTALDALAGRIERLHQVTVETVVVGDEPLDDRSRAVVQACGEALSNAARHSGAKAFSVYVEAAPDGISAYVTDDGKGFDMASVPADRHGIRDSIVGRIERQGGSARVVSELGEGTEVQMHVPGVTR